MKRSPTEQIETAQSLAFESEVPTNVTRVFTLLNSEIEPRFQEIEIASSFQIPHFQIIGLPGPEVSEAKDRIRSAIESIGWEFPRRKIILNLSPASVRKQGTGLDLGMAIAVLSESASIAGSTNPYAGKRVFAWGELGLNGRVKAVRSPVRAIAAALRAEAEIMLLALEDREEFEKARALFPEVDLPKMHFVDDLREIRSPVSEERKPSSPRNGLRFEGKPSSPPHSTLLPLSEETARFLQVAAAGMHHFLMLGPKGVGKSHALDWFIALQPAAETEILRSRLYISELSGKRNEALHRRIGVGCKAPSLIGSFSGGRLRPGEFSLAHGGVLLADEFPEWPRDAREALREPLERRNITLTRTEGSLDIPADFIFAGNGNLCPCGGFPMRPSSLGKNTGGPQERSCRCLPSDRMKYLARLSGPVLDRLDLVYPLTLAPDQATRKVGFLKSQSIVLKARGRLRHAYSSAPGRLTSDALEKILSDTPRLQKALDAFPFESLRDRHKTLRIALTLSAFQDFPIEEAWSETGKVERILIEAKSLRIQAQKTLEA